MLKITLYKHHPTPGEGTQNDSYKILAKTSGFCLDRIQAHLFCRSREVQIDFKGYNISLGVDVCSWK